MTREFLPWIALNKTSLGNVSLIAASLGTGKKVPSVEGRLLKIILVKKQTNKQTVIPQVPRVFLLKSYFILCILQLAYKVTFKNVGNENLYKVHIF